MLQAGLPQSFSRERGSILLFVYGTLRNPRTQEYVLHHAERATGDKIVGYQKETFRTPEGKHFDTITKSGPGEVTGKILEVSQADLEKLKSWEDEYSLISVVLKDGRHAKAFQLKNNDKLGKE